MIVVLKVSRQIEFLLGICYHWCMQHYIRFAYIFIVSQGECIWFHLYM